MGDMCLQQSVPNGGNVLTSELSRGDRDVRLHQVRGDEVRQEADLIF